jgi:hypothetical protein
MNGIDSKPFIDCAPHIDLDVLTQLELEICTGIALSDVKAGVYGPGVANAERYGNFLKMKSEMSVDTSELGVRWRRMTHNQQNLFAKLHFHLYNPSTVVYLREPKKGTDTKIAYLRKGQEVAYDWTTNIAHFPGLRAWLDDQVGTVFEQIGRVLFFIHDHDSTLLLHRDGVKSMSHRSEFLWLNPTGLKQFYIYDEDTTVKHTVDTRAAFFNDLDMHGGESNPQMTWSLRIDGVFTQEFRSKLGISHLPHY